MKCSGEKFQNFTTGTMEWNNMIRLAIQTSDTKKITTNTTTQQ